MLLLSATSALKSALWCFGVVSGHLPFVQLNVAVYLNWHVFEVGRD